jgi:hypothetical protein
MSSGRTLLEGSRISLRQKARHALLAGLLGVLDFLDERVHYFP